MLTRHAVHAVGLVLGLLALPSWAGTYSVTKQDDDGTSGSLTWAISQANSDFGPSTITIDVPLVRLHNSLPTVNEDTLVLDGNGSVIDAQGHLFSQFNSSGHLLKDFVLENAAFGIQLNRGAHDCTLFPHHRAGQWEQWSLPFGSLQQRDRILSPRTKCHRRDSAPGGSKRESRRPPERPPLRTRTASSSPAIRWTTRSSTTRSRTTWVPLSLSTMGPNAPLFATTTLHRQAQSGVYVNASRAQVLDNEILECGSFGVYLASNAADTTVARNHIEETHLAGIRASGSARPVLFANTVLYAREDYGVSLVDAYGGTVGPGNVVGFASYGGIFLKNADPVTVTRNFVTANVGPGVAVASNKPRSSQAEVLIDSNAIQINTIGISVAPGAYGVRCLLNEVRQNLGTGIRMIGDFDNLEDELGHAIQGNVVTQNGFTGISTYGCSGVSIYANLVAGGQGAGLDVQFGGLNTDVTSNWTLSNTVGVSMPLAEGVTVEDNFVVSNERHGIHYGAERHFIRNNIVLANDLHGLSCFLPDSRSLLTNNSVVGNAIGSATSGTSRNNIFHGNNKDAVFTGGLDMDFCNLSSYWGGNPNSRSNFSGDPLFRDEPSFDYHIESSSPCRNRGSNNAPGLPAYDFDATPWPPDTGDDRILEGTADVGADRIQLAPPRRRRRSRLDAASHPPRVLGCRWSDLGGSGGEMGVRPTSSGG